MATEAVAFSKQEGRDLQWLASIPDLMALTPPWPPLISPPGLLPAEFAVGPASPIERPSHRVGDYVERLMRRWLSLTPGVSAIEQGLVIQDGKRTVGELDFLFRHGGEQHHLEVALKFYLHCPERGENSCAGISHFPGPNATDDFEKKRDRLLLHQLPLGRASFPEITASHALVKGMIFYRPGETPPPTFPAAMNPTHLRGTWIRSSEIDRLLDEPAWRRSRGFLMEKPHWLGGWTAESGETLHPPEKLHRHLQSHFATRERPVVLSLAAEGDKKERERLIVVAPGWPN